jgi:hypothetical protein
LKLYGLLALISLLLLVGSAPALPDSPSGQELDIAPFALRCCVVDTQTVATEFDYAQALRLGSSADKTADGHYVYGLQWSEERDVSEVVVKFREGSTAPAAKLEYWFRQWPFPGPRLPSTQDVFDDAWQGSWLSAQMKTQCEQTVCHYSFAPLADQENSRAANLPGVQYRRTLKIRLVFASEPALESVHVFTGSVESPVTLRVELGASESSQHVWDGHFRIYNGRLESVQLWKGASGDAASADHFHVTTAGRPKGLIVALIAARPSLAGSNDATIATLESGDRTFSFAIRDLDKGPIYVPAFHAYVTQASDQGSFSPSIKKADGEIREMVAKEPEQTYERASKDIPALDPVDRERGILYLPLAADASWQKFAVEWGGNIYISKRGVKAKGKELERLEWDGDRINWRIGTGLQPSYRPDWHDSSLSTLDDQLPVAHARWSSDGVDYDEESFATLLSGSLAPDDPGRDEQTPAILMVKLIARNSAAGAGTAHVWLATKPAENVSFDNDELMTKDGLVRAFVQTPEQSKVSVAAVADGDDQLQGIHAEIPLGPNEQQTLIFKLPFIPRLSPAERTQLAALDYSAQRDRVVKYWQNLIAANVPFEIPEPELNSFARAVIPHVHITATKDPHSGLYVLAAASYMYPVDANEGVFQSLMLDTLGDHAMAAKFLNTFVQLQGTKTFGGTYTGDQKDVYGGVKVSADYEYGAPGGYSLDHGAVLWALGEHYLYSRDKDWFRQVAPSMKRAADWIIEQRKLTEVYYRGEKVPEFGLLPSAKLEDPAEWGHWFAVDAYAAAGMNNLAIALKDTGDPQTQHYAEEATSFNADLRSAFLRASQNAPVTRMWDGAYEPWFPTRVYEKLRLFGSDRAGYYSRYGEKTPSLYRLSATREVLYGPITLLLTNVIHPNEPAAQWILDDWEDNQTMSTPLGLNVHGWVDDADWFSRGGMVFQANLQNPTWVYLERNEIPDALRDFYNGFVSCYYPSVNALSEEYHQWIHASGPFYKSPDEAAVVHRVRDLLVVEKENALWIAEGLPRPWLAPGQVVKVHGIATYFGPLSYEIHAQTGAVAAVVDLPSRNSYKEAWLVIREPNGKPIHAVQVDNKPWTDFDAAGERIRLPIKKGPINVTVQF